MFLESWNLVPWRLLLCPGMVRKYRRLVIPGNQPHASSSTFLSVKGGKTIGQLRTEQTFSNNGYHFICSFNRCFLRSYHGSETSGDDINREWRQINTSSALLGVHMYQAHYRRYPTLTTTWQSKISYPQFTDEDTECHRAEVSFSPSTTSKGIPGLWTLSMACEQSPCSCSMIPPLNTC